MVLANKITEPDYDDAAHKYFLGEITYLSATQLLDKFKPKFDVEERSAYMSNRYGCTPQYWKDKWAEISGTSLERGNDIHDAKERELYRDGIDHINDKVLKVQRRKNFPVLLDYYDLPDGVYPELKLWHHDWQIAGRADKFIIRDSGKLLRIRYADIEDHKTNRVITDQSFRDPATGQFEMMLGPLAHLQNCTKVHYTLQLSIYQFMAEYFGFKPGKRTIIHYPHPIPELGTPDPVRTEVPYLRAEVLSMLQYLNFNKCHKELL